MSELIHTKTAPPSWMGDKIRRDALLGQLDGALSKRLTLIHAPAGYGKTSLLLQWRLRHSQEDVLIAWLTLEKDDAELEHLSRYISLAIEQRDFRAPRIKAGVKAADLPPRSALSAIINRLMR